jgi:pimeloyl-ACP methyl ester carboxylesterase
MKIVNHQSINVHYWIFGKGSPIVFLHGFLEDHTMWKSIKKEFLKTHQVILIDLPCHGLTKFDGEICSMELMAKCVHHVLKKEQISNPKVIGHSMGGYVGLELLKMLPIQLTLVHSNFWADDEEKKISRNRVVDVVKTKKTFFINEAIPNLFWKNNILKCKRDIGRLIKKASSIPSKQIISATKGMRDRQDNSLLLKKHKVKIIQGEFDPIIPKDLMLNHLNNLNVKLPCHVIKNVGHMSIWENPKKLISMVREKL